MSRISVGPGCAEMSGIISSKYSDLDTSGNLCRKKVRVSVSLVPGLSGKTGGGEGGGKKGV